MGEKIQVSPPLLEFFIIMVRRFFSLLIVFVYFLSCNVNDDIEQTPVGIEGISIGNFPIIDGSDSTEPLRTLLMCKLLGFDYQWVRSPFVQRAGPKRVEPNYTCPQEEWAHLELDCLLRNNTHPSFLKLIDGEVEVQTVAIDAIPDDKEGMDIGEKTRVIFAEAVRSAKTVVWNGPMGVFENPTLAKGTIAMAQALADSDAVTIVGGGDSAAACEQLGFADQITHISTGGGASLEFLEGLELPGIACLEDK